MNNKKTLLYALLVMFLWGSLFPIVKLGFSAYNVVGIYDILLFAGIRFTICGVLICIYAFMRNRESFHVSGNILKLILLSGLFAIILHYAFTYIGLKLTDSSKTAILKQLGALFYICFSALFFKDDKVTFKKILGAMLGFGGIVAMNFTNGELKFYVGDALIIAASFCTVFSNVISKKVFLKASPVTSTGISQLFGGLILLFVGFIGGGRVSFAFDNSLFIMLYICAASCVSYCIWFQAVKKANLSKLFIIKFAEPMFATIMAGILLGENIFKLQYILGFLLIAAGITISSLLPNFKLLSR